MKMIFAMTAATLTFGAVTVDAHTTSLNLNMASLNQFAQWTTIDI